MNEFQLNRRQALIASGLGTMSLGLPGVVMGADKVDASGKAVAAEKSCIFVLLCGGPSHVDTWDMKPEAPLDYRGPYQPIATKVPGVMLCGKIILNSLSSEILFRPRSESRLLIQVNAFSLGTSHE